MIVAEAWINHCIGGVKSWTLAIQCSGFRVRHFSFGCPPPIKISLFVSTVESVLLYGCEAWTLTKRLEKQLDGCYTRMLRTVMGVHWSQHVTNEDLYQDLPKFSEKIRGSRLQFAGHCQRRDDELVSKLVLWQPSHGQRQRGRRKLNYVDSLTLYTGFQIVELQTAMLDRAVWRATIVRGPHST